MIGFRFTLVLGVVLGAGEMLAQPPTLVLPGSSAEGAQKSNNPLANYGNDRHEGAAAAFQEALKAERQHNRPRALRLLILSLQRDPVLDKALFDMGVLCAQEDRWEDALGFQREAIKRALPDSEVAKAAAAELVRLQAIAPMAATPDGRKIRDYDIRLVRIAATRDPVKIAVGSRTELTGKDPGRWEGWALAGVADAEAGEFQKSRDELRKAAELTPAANQRRLSDAADIAEGEVKFKDSLDKANDLKGDIWEKQKYGEAAAAYGEAWNSSDASKASPGHWKVGLDAVTAYMLADDISNAVKILIDVRAYAPADYDSRIASMLRELAKLPDGAKAGADNPAGEKKPTVEEARLRIRADVGSPVTPHMELISRPDPPLIDNGRIVVTVPDEEIDNTGKLEVGYKSSQSLYELYQSGLASDPPAPPGPDVLASQPPAQPVSDTSPATPGPPKAAPSFARAAAETQVPMVLPHSAAETPAPSPGLPPPPSIPRGGGVPVHVESKPPGASITFDADTNPSSPITCVSPCNVNMAPGRHTLVARLAGYRDFSKIIEDVRKAESPLTIDLEAMAGTVFVESEPPNLSILVNGKEIGRVTPATLTLPAGKYQIGVVGGDVDDDVIIVDGGIGKIPKLHVK